jgi:DNA-binding MarR family transcriptional regulator
MNDSRNELSSLDGTLSPDAADTVETLLDDIDAAMHRMGRLMAASHARFQSASGIATPHYMVLKTVATEGPARVSDLAALLGVKNPAASMLIQNLEAEGYVERRHDGRDNRVVIVSLTPAGEERLAQAEVCRRAMSRRLTESLSVEDLEALKRIIVTIADSIAQGT